MDVSTSDEGSDRPALADAAECREDAGVGYVALCPSPVADVSIPAVVNCGKPGKAVYLARCGQRATVRWDWWSEGMTCFYEQGTLVGIEYRSSTPIYCGQTSSLLRRGSTEACPASAESLLYDCNPIRG